MTGGPPAPVPDRRGAAGTGRRAARHGRLLPPVPVLAVLLALLLAAVGILLAPRLTAPESAVRTDTYAEALRAARTGVVELTSFDHLALDEDAAQVRRVTTGDLREESLAQLEQRRQELLDARAVVDTEVVGAGVTRALEDEATVVLVLESTQRSATAERAQLLRYRIEVELVRQGGRWLLSGITGR